MMKKIEVRAANGRFMGLLLLLLTAFGFTACNNEDDVEGILNNKTWKMSRLTTPGNAAPFLPLWTDSQGNYNQKAYETSINLLNTEGNFIVKFNVAETNNILDGEMEVTGVKIHFKTKVRIDAKTRNITMDPVTTGNETDCLAAEFIKGMKSLQYYKGDSNNITLYYQAEGESLTKIIGFTPK